VVFVDVLCGWNTQNIITAGPWLAGSRGDYNNIILWEKNIITYTIVAVLLCVTTIILFFIIIFGSRTCLDKIVERCLTDFSVLCQVVVLFG